MLKSLKILKKSLKSLFNKEKSLYKSLKILIPYFYPLKTNKCVQSSSSTCNNLDNKVSPSFNSRSPSFLDL